MPLEAPPGAREVAQCGGGRRHVGADRAAGGQRGGGVERVVGARDGQLHLDPVEHEARAARRELGRGVEGPQPGAVARERQQRRAIPDDRVLGRGEEGAEGRLDVALRGVGRVVVELGVREHRDAAVELEQRAVGLVRLDHQPLARPPARVRARRAHLPADEVARIRPRAAQRVDEHARGRRLAVRARDGDRRAQARELAEQVGAVQLARGGGALGVLGRDRGRVDDLGALGHVGGVVALDGLDPGRAQARGVGGAARAVRAGHLGPELARDQREAAHARAADPHEVQAPA